MQTIIRVKISYKDELDSSLEKLLYHVVRLAIKDYRDARYRSEVRQFLFSSYFEDIMDNFHRNPEIDRDKIINGKVKESYWLME